MRSLCALIICCLSLQAAAALSAEHYWSENGIEFYLEAHHTVVVTVPTAKPLNRHSIETSVDTYADGGRWDFTLPELIDWDSIPSEWF
jgi:hypothetical protein